jgi:hypothetical protein
MKSLIGLVFAGVAAITLIAPAPLASCESTACMFAIVPPNDPQFSSYVAQVRAQSTAVFLGTVIAFTHDSILSYPELLRQQVWKGPRDSIVRIVTGIAPRTTTVTDSTGRTRVSMTQVSNNCALPLIEGEAWLIFARSDSAGNLVSSMCSASARRDKADPALRELR